EFVATERKCELLRSGRYPRSFAVQAVVAQRCGRSNSPERCGNTLLHACSNRAQPPNSWGWSGRRDSNPRRPAWKAGTCIFTAWKPQTTLNSALLTAVHYTAENTAVAKSFWDLLPWHVLQLLPTRPRYTDQVLRAPQPRVVSRPA